MPVAVPARMLQFEAKQTRRLERRHLDGRRRRHEVGLVEGELDLCEVGSAIAVGVEAEMGSHGQQPSTCWSVGALDRACCSKSLELSPSFW